MKTLLLKSLIILLVVFTSCNGDDEAAPRGAYDNGVIVTNEGNFGSANSSVTFYDRKSGETDQTIFQTVNNVSPLGDVLQSAASNQGLIYLVVNNSNKVEVVNAFTFESEYTMSGLQQPRYVAFMNGKGYLTQWVSFSDPGVVTVFDPETGDKESNIEVGFSPEAIVAINNKLYVTEAFGNQLHIVDLDDDNTVSTLTIGDGASEMVVDGDNNIWIACEGGTDENFEPLDNGSIYHIDTQTDQIATTIDVNTNYEGELAVSGNGQSVFFFLDNSVFTFDISNISLGDPLFTVSEATSLYSIGVHPGSDIIYVADSKGFSDDGEVFRYDMNGDLIDSFTTGVGPNGFLFN